MILACHQPLFLPWPGFFYKAARADLLVLLDHVPFPMGTTWVSRNRLKNESGAFWLTVPVKKKGRRNAPINTMEVFNERNWKRKHLQSIRQAYAHAPYLEDHMPFFLDFYGRSWEKLVELNLAAIQYLNQVLDIKTPFHLSSRLGVEGRGTELLAEICRKVGADSYLTIAASKKYLDLARLEGAGIQPLFYQLKPPVYPQLWGDFVANLSVVDMLLCCGPRARSLILTSGHPLDSP